MGAEHDGVSGAKAGKCGGRCTQLGQMVRGGGVLLHNTKPTGLAFICFVVVNRRELSANRIDFGFFVYFVNSIFELSPPPSPLQAHYPEVRS